jgi:hypothetical protein
VPDPGYDGRLHRIRRVPPSSDILKRMGVPKTEYDDFIRTAPADPIWDGVDFISAAHSGSTPQLNINGWLDIGAYETVKLFEFQQHHPEQYLIMAAAGHSAMIRAASPAGDVGRPPDGQHHISLQPRHHLGLVPPLPERGGGYLGPDAQGAGVSDGGRSMAGGRPLAVARHRVVLALPRQRRPCPIPMG